jgi:glycosidase/outer membrane protein assembly factor BamB
MGLRSCGLLLSIAGALGTGLATNPAQASSLRISPGTDHRAANEVEADYGISHLFIDELAKQSTPITVFFDPQTTGVAQAEVFTNLNRREFATASPNGDGIEEGINPPPGNTVAAGDERHYYHALPMNPIAGGYQLTVAASKTGAYRLTARYRLTSDPPGTYRWYGDEQGSPGISKRDFAVVVSPLRAREIQLYEANPLTITASGTAPDQRGTFAAMAHTTGTTGGSGFSLGYLRQLGVNALWLQPIHPRGIDGRLTDPGTGQPYDLGSPYAVKNYFAAMPLMASTVRPGNSPAASDTPAGRAEALGEFHDFVRAAAAQRIGIFLDVPFNHTAHDAELGPAGVAAWGTAGSEQTTQIRSLEARVFSRTNEYDMRASSADTIAAAPDRFDFGKWSDVADLYFGRYAALVPNGQFRDQYQNEGDWFDYSVGDETATGSGNGHFDRITQRLWQFFGDYLQFWLDQTDYPANQQHAPLGVVGGIIGLRADFAQGLPPQAWEYLINRTRARRWDFTFMAESLDGGHVGYRSARHFDVVNDSLVNELHNATTASALQRVFGERQFYGDTLILLNTTSQDEDTYRDPYQGAMRFAVNSAMYGITLIFPGQELGLKGSVVPAGAPGGTPFGYDRYVTDPNFHKSIPQFLTYNSMMPLWRQLAANRGDAVHMLALYSAISHARAESPALRSNSTSFLTLKGGGRSDSIFAVGKTEQPGADPARSDVVFAFVNLDLGTASATPPDKGFDVNIAAGQDNLFGIRADHRYDVKNIAADNANERNRCLWGSGRTGADILQQGIAVALNRLPTDEAGWTSAPYEAQYLRLIDLTASPGACGAPGPAKHAVLTRSYDNGRTGANISEAALTPVAVKTQGLSKAFSLTLTGDDPRIEAQPLYVPDVPMADGSRHDVIYLFSMSNHVWAFDAATGAALWPRPVSLGPPFLPAPDDPVDIYHINRSFGILSTPVIDREQMTIYAVNWIVDRQGQRQLHLNALRLQDGAPPPGKDQPLPIEASVVNAAGQRIALNQVQKQRAALLLTPLAPRASAQQHKMLYVATTGDDSPPPKPDATLGHHGWVVAFDVDQWRQTAAWIATPNSFGGGIWQSSQGLSADADGNIYAITSNGGYLVNPDGTKPDFNGRTDFAESFVRLSYHDGPTGASLTLADWFSPFRDATRRNWTNAEVAPFGKGYNYEDQDVGSGGPVLPPDTTTVLGAGKDGVLYVLDRNNMGRSLGDLAKLKAPPAFLTFDPDRTHPAYRAASPDGDLDFKPQPGVKTRHLHGSPVYWDSAAHGPMLFTWGENSELRAFAMDASGRTRLLAHGSELASAALARAADGLGGMPGGMLSLSANGRNDGIVWGTAPVDGNANMDVVAGIVRAYDASTFDPPASEGGPAGLRLIWQQAGFTYSKFCPPVVADGRLLVPTYDGRVDVYRLGTGDH